MKILFIILDGWPTFRPDVTALWGNYLFKRGVHTDICTIETEGNRNKIWPAGQALLSKKMPNKIIEQLKSFLHDSFFLWKSLSGSYSAIMVRDKSFAAVVALLFCRIKHRPCFYWMSFPIAESLVSLSHRIDWRKEPARWLYLSWRGYIGGWLMRQIVLPNVDHVFVQSTKMKQDLCEMGILASHMTPVPMCIAPERFPEPLPFAPNPGGRRVIGYLGECSKVRRIDFLFEVMVTVRDKFPDALLLLVGDAYETDDKKWLADLILNLNLQNHVKITGWLPMEQVSQAFAEVEVALALVPPDPLLDCASPTKLVEYLAMGRPVVANSHPDQKEVIENSLGGLCVAFDVTEYSNAIIELLSDSERCAGMAKSGRAWVLENRNYETCADGLLKNLQELIK